MSIHYPPKYRYALFEPWDKEAFEFIKQVARSKGYPKITGDEKGKNHFLVSLIRTQKSLHGWRDFLVDVLNEMKKSSKIDVEYFNAKYSPESISKETPAWVTYEEDKIVSDFIDELETRKIDFIGNDDEISEFILRFILGQLSYDWEQTIMMIWEMLGDGNKLSVRELNKELKNFDYLRLFEV